MENKTKKIDNFGWISIHRKIINNPIFDNPVALKIWIWCLIKAAREETTILLGRQKIKLKTGQFIFGSITACEQLKMSKSTIHYWLEFLKVERYIERKTTNKYSIITILNYSKYQNVERQVERRRNAKRTLNETNNKYNRYNMQDKYINTPQAELVSFFSSTFEKRFQKPYLPFKSDYINMSELLKKYSMDQLKKYISWYIYWDSWQTKSGYTIGKFYRHINEVISSASPYKY